MYQKIMVPLDGSPFSEEVLPLAIGAARRSGAELRLVHVMEPLIGRMIVEAGDGAEKQLQGLAARIATEQGVPATAELLIGRALPELCGYIEREGIDLVVMATHGWGGLQRAWLGSTTDALVREIAVPVLAVRPRERAPAATPPPGTEPGTGQIPGAAIAAAGHTAHGSALLEGTLAARPLLPLDGSELAESALEPLLDLVGPDAHYTLLRVIQIPVTPDMMTGSLAAEVWYEQVPVHEHQVQGYLDSVASRLAGRVREVEMVVLTELNPAIAILNYAAEHQVDLIAISTRGHGGLRRLALGSVTDKVLRGADVPVLVVRPE